MLKNSYKKSRLCGTSKQAQISVCLPSEIDAKNREPGGGAGAYTGLPACPQKVGKKSTVGQTQTPSKFTQAPAQKRPPGRDYPQEGLRAVRLHTSAKNLPCVFPFFSEFQFFPPLPPMPQAELCILHYVVYFCTLTTLY